MRSQRLLCAGCRSRRRDRRPGPRRVHPHDHARNRAPPPPPALGRAHLHIVGFEHALHAEFPDPRTGDVDHQKISGNRKTYALFLIGGVRWDIPPALDAELRAVLDKLETEWRAVVAAVSQEDRNIQKRTQDVGRDGPEPRP